MRKEFSLRLRSLRENKADEFYYFVYYVSFFETLGTYVRNGYIPMRDVMQLYKGPLLDLEIASIEFIKEWQDEAHMADGLFSNALYLMSRTKTCECHPWYYHTLYRIVRITWH